MKEAPGCITVPALIVVVPIRLLWELLALIGRGLVGYVARPLGWLVYQGLVRPVVWLSRLLWELLTLIGRGLVRYVLRPLGWLFRVVVAIPLRWVGDAILAPLGRAVYRYLLRPIGRGLARCVRIVVLSLAYAAEWVGRGLAALWHAAWPLVAALGLGIARAWRLAGIVLFHLLVRPARWVWRTFLRPVLRAVARAWRVTVLTPVRWLHVNVLKPAGAAVRSAFRAVGLDTRRP